MSEFFDGGSRILKIGGGGEIRTHEGLSALAVFKTAWDNRSLPLREKSKWDIVDNIKTILQRQTEYIYIPDLSPHV